MVYVTKNWKAFSLALMLLLAACAQSDEAATIQEASADPVDSLTAARNSFELIAYIETFSGGLNLNDANIATQFDRKAAQLATTGGVTSSALRATSEMLAQVCVTASADANRRRLVYGDVNLDRLPAAVTATERRRLVENLLIRSTGRKPAPATLDDGVRGFDELLATGVVPNSNAGTLQAAQGICTAIVSSAVAGLGY